MLTCSSKHVKAYRITVKQLHIMLIQCVNYAVRWNLALHSNHALMSGADRCHAIILISSFELQTFVTQAWLRPVHCSSNFEILVERAKSVFTKYVYMLPLMYLCCFATALMQNSRRASARINVRLKYKAVHCSSNFEISVKRVKSVFTKYVYMLPLMYLCCFATALMQNFRRASARINVRLKYKAVAWPQGMQASIF